MIARSVSPNILLCKRAFQIYRSLVFTFLIFSFSKPLYSCTNEANCIEQGQWSLGFAMGLGARTNPLTNSDNIPQILLLDIAWYGERAYFDNGELGYRWLETKHFDVDTYLSIDRERLHFQFWGSNNIFNIVNTPDAVVDKDPDEVVDGNPVNPPEDPGKLSPDDIQTRNWAGLFGNRIQYTLGSHKFSLALETDITNRHSGHILRLEYVKQWSGDKWQLRLNPSIAYKSDAIVDYYYGIDIRDTPDEQYFYQGKGGVQTGLSVFYHYTLSEKWQLLFSASHRRLHAGMTKSPLVDKQYINSLFFGIGYRF